MLITIIYYKETYSGYVGNSTDEDIERNARAANDLVNVLTMMKLVDGRVDFDTLPLYVQEMVKKSVCMITEYYLLNGGYEAVQSSNSSGLSSVSAGNFSYGNAKGSSDGSSLVEGISPMALELLSLSGLMYTGVCVK